jgi:hypothetical protein
MLFIGSRDGLLYVFGSEMTPAYIGWSESYVNDDHVRKGIYKLTRPYTIGGLFPLIEYVSRRNINNIRNE